MLPGHGGPGSPPRVSVFFFAGKKRELVSQVLCTNPTAEKKTCKPNAMALPMLINTCTASLEASATIHVHVHVHVDLA